MKTNSNSLPPEPVAADVTRRVAFRLGLTLPVAATVAALAGLGPQQGRRL